MSNIRGKIRMVLNNWKVFIRRLIWASVIIIVCAVGYSQIGNRILRPLAKSQLQQLTGTNVEIHTIDFEKNGFVRMNLLAIGCLGPDDYKNAVLVAKTADVHFSLLSILTFHPRIKQITLSDFTINAQYDSDKMRWNFGLFDIKRSSGREHKLPAIIAKSGILKLRVIKDGRVKPVAVAGINAELVPTADTDDTYDFQLYTDKSLGFVGTRIQGTWNRSNSETASKIKLKGNLKMSPSPLFGNTWTVDDMLMELSYNDNDISIERFDCSMGKSTATVSGVIDTSKLKYDLRFKLNNMPLSDEPIANAIVYRPEVLERLPLNLRKFLEMYNPRGIGSLDLRSKGRFDELSKSKWLGTIECGDISVRYEKFPYLLEHMTGKIELTEKFITIDNLNCKHGDVDLSINGFLGNPPKASDYDIHISSPNMLLDEDLYRSLETDHKKLWFIFTPSGLAKIDQRLSRSAEKGKETNLTVELLDVQAAYKHFPYPLKKLKGKVHITRGSIGFENVISEYLGRSITLNGQVTETDSPRPRYNIIVDADNIPIDGTLRAALPEKHKMFYGYFEVDALTDVRVKVFPNEVGRRLVEYIADVNIKGASLIYEKFPIPLWDVYVDAVLTPDKILLKKMTGQNGSCQLSLNGTVWPSNEEFENMGFCLSLQANGLDLNDNSLKALPPGVSNVLKQLRPSGTVNISADVNIDARANDCKPFKIVIDCLGNELSLEKFPYPIENLTGSVVITDNKIELKNLLAAGTDNMDPNATPAKIALNGNIDHIDGNVNNGLFDLRVSNLNIDTLAVALPEKLRESFDSISPTGQVDLNVDKATFFINDLDQKCIDFSSKIDLKKCGFSDRKILSDLDGTINLKALYKFDLGLENATAVFHSQAMNVRGKKITELKADIVYDPDKKMFVSKQFTADFYKGRMIGDADLTASQKDLYRYALKIAFDDVDVKRLLASADSDSPAQGKAAGAFTASGLVGNAKSNRGRLNIDVRNMKLAERSLLGKVIAAMQLANPTDFIFTDVTIDAYLKNNNLIFDSVNLSGESMLLTGKGRLNMATNYIDMVFTASGRTITSNPTFIESLAKGLGSAMVNVQVQGNIEDPVITTNALPVITAPFELLGD